MFNGNRNRGRKEESELKKIRIPVQVTKKEKQLIQEKKEKAVRFAEELKSAQEDLQKLQEAMEYLNTTFKIGADIQHKKYGLGTITAHNGGSIEIELANGEKRNLE